MSQKKPWRYDALIMVFLALISVAVSAFLLRGAYLDTTYADWMYHAFRAQSLAQHGLVSWDSVWDNGISYWRAYQIVPAAITVAVASLAQVTIPKAMIIISVALYALLHVGIYAGVRSFDRSRQAAFTTALLSFMFSGYWLIMKDYSISFAAVCVPLMLVIWRRSPETRTRQMVFALLIGASVYVHPLLAVCFGGLWLVSKFAMRATFSLRYSLLECLLIIAPAIFYAWGLSQYDAAFVAPYQLGKDFIYGMAGAFRAGSVFTYVIPALFIVALFLSHWLSPAGRVLFWFTTIITIVAVINLRTPYLDVVNRFQPSRLLFFIVIGYLFVFGEAIDSFAKRLKRIPQWTKGAAIAVLFGIAMGQTLSDTATYAATPVRSLPDPVQEFLQARPGIRVDGGIFIVNSIISSYNHPELRFSNGYNDHLLPQLTNDRLSKLLDEASPVVNISAATITTVQNYIQVLGIKYVFLPATSPYIQPLIDAGYRVEARLNTPDYRSVVLAHPGQPTYVTSISDSTAAALTADTLANIKPGSAEYYRLLDAAVARVASIESTSNLAPSRVGLNFAAPDQLEVTLPAQSSPQHIYLAQSYSRHWQASAGSLARTTEGMMVLTAPAGTSSVRLTHTWGMIPYVQAAALAAAALIIIAVAIAQRRRTGRTLTKTEAQAS